MALDLETTTMHAASARIVEMTLAALDSELKVLRSFTQRLNPESSIPTAATELHGISDQDVQGEPLFRDVAARVQGFVRGATLIAYNGRRFDIPVLHRHLRAVGQPGIQGNPLIDPYLLFTEDAPRTLTAACQFYLGRTHSQAHQSAADVQVMLDVLRMQLMRRRLAKARS
ncbi:MAG: 3'-5' exonuclease [Halobacteriales archaeon]|nr:3'-5' exonuclease [Halobacteriales archaeon]